MSVEEITAIQHDSKEKIEAAKTLNKEIQDLEADPGWLDIKGLEKLEKLIGQAKKQLFGGDHLDGVGVTKKDIVCLDGHLEEGLEQVDTGLLSGVGDEVRVMANELEGNNKASGEVECLEGLLEEGLEQVGAGLFLLDDGPLQVELDAVEIHQVGF